MCRKYFDLMCDHASKSNDYFFTYHSWFYLFQDTTVFGNSHHIIIWSDGGVVGVRMVRRLPFHKLPGAIDSIKVLLNGASESSTFGLVLHVWV